MTTVQIPEKRRGATTVELFLFGRRLTVTLRGGALDQLRMLSLRRAASKA